MQAQDVASGHWSFGVRLPGSTNADIDRATAQRQIVRTWPMRGTIHFVPPPDVSWLLEPTGARMLRGGRAALADLGPGPPDGRGRGRRHRRGPGRWPLTRAQVLASLQAQGIDASGQRGYHLLWFASQTGVSVIGPQRGKEQTFALAADWLPAARAGSRRGAAHPGRAVLPQPRTQRRPPTSPAGPGSPPRTRRRLSRCWATSWPRWRSASGAAAQRGGAGAPGWHDDDVERLAAGAGVDELLVPPASTSSCWATRTAGWLPTPMPWQR